MTKLVFEWRHPDKIIDYLKIHLLLPSWGINKGKDAVSGQPTMRIGFSAATELSYSKEKGVDWCITAQVIGFGVSMHRQWNY
jgi:hypothetical protein